MALAAILGIVLLSAASASIHCPCSKPGVEGTIVGFTARNGTTDNVTLYIVAEPKLGDQLDLWGIKAIGDAIVPVNGLIVTVTLDSEAVAEMTTDEEGYILLGIDEPGRYEISGGDATLVFDVEAEEPEEPEEPDEPEVINEPADEGFADDNPPVGGVPETAKPPPKVASWDDGSTALYIVVAIIIIALVLVLLKRRK